LGIAIFEMSENSTAQTSGVEIVFDPSGAARVMQITPNEAEQRSLFWMNEANPTFLVAEPPGLRGEPRFDVEFGIDSNKRLVLTARDIKNGQLLLSGCPVVKLT
jgi:hypothetical protein